MAKKTGTKVPTPPDPLPTRRTCGTMQVHERLLRTAPGYREARDNSENQALRFTLQPMAGRSGCTKIPVVVHVLYNTAAQNISDAQIQSQIDVLNADFRRRTPTSARSRQALRRSRDARVQFALATRDPSGNPTNGITRTQTRRSTAIADIDDDQVGRHRRRGAVAGRHDI